MYIEYAYYFKNAIIYIINAYAYYNIYQRQRNIRIIVILFASQTKYSCPRCFCFFNWFYLQLLCLKLEGAPNLARFFSQVSLDYFSLDFLAQAYYVSSRHRVSIVSVSLLLLLTVSISNDHNYTKAQIGHILFIIFPTIYCGNKHG